MDSEKLRVPPALYSEFLLVHPHPKARPARDGYHAWGIYRFLSDRKRAHDARCHAVGLAYRHRTLGDRLRAHARRGAQRRTARVVFTFKPKERSENSERSFFYTNLASFILTRRECVQFSSSPPPLSVRVLRPGQMFFVPQSP